MEIKKFDLFKTQKQFTGKLKLYGKLFGITVLKNNFSCLQATKAKRVLQILYCSSMDLNTAYLNPFSGERLCSLTQTHNLKHLNVLQ